jgi:L-ascorbate metabolism protein UlaG (beta-lactamase superfamily)
MLFDRFNALEVKKNSISLMWFNRYSGTAIKTPGKSIVIDPTEIEAENLKVDILIVSHEHFDHLDKGIVGKMQSHILIGPSNVIGELKGTGKNLRPIKLGEEIDIEGVKITGEKGMHPCIEPLSFVIKSEDGIVLYHAIDNQTFEGMKEIGEKYEPDIAIVPIGIAPGTSPGKGAEAIKLLKPKIAIPHHSERGFEEFERKVKESNLAEVIILKRGEIYTYSK